MIPPLGAHFQCFQLYLLLFVAKRRCLDITVLLFSIQIFVAIILSVIRFPISYAALSEFAICEVSRYLSKPFLWLFGLFDGSQLLTFMTFMLL